jgi:two-component system, LytTR family, response regulator
MIDTYITIRNNGRRLAIDPGEIVFLKGEGCYTKLFIDYNEGSILIPKPLYILKVQLSCTNFLQCHKSYLVNSCKITAFDSKNRTIKVGKHVIQVSRRKSAHIFQQLSVLKIPDVDLADFK